MHLLPGTNKHTWNFSDNNSKADDPCHDIHFRHHKKLMHGIFENSLHHRNKSTLVKSKAAPGAKISFHGIQHTCFPSRSTSRSWIAFTSTDASEEHLLTQIVI
ncbi:hypothetical protein CEXT_509821 [Caerostris extrusa]|uniref:Uncharacterized protein n=1 Tax=Caerostris extrusa TaxID=172846 RepID=A0AAV4NH82_CAEEX|nr:hypothetical protein CEXT_509821 [Caerostris extrusa]